MHFKHDDVYVGRVVNFDGSYRAKLNIIYYDIVFTVNFQFVKRSRNGKHIELVDGYNLPVLFF